ncbi:hypothetical protein BC938DRAFT_472797, partial [Jimgerdemannia flammicorona]
MKVGVSVARGFSTVTRPLIRSRPAWGSKSMFSTTMVKVIRSRWLDEDPKGGAGHIRSKEVVVMEVVGLPYCCGLEVVALDDQIVDVPHVLKLLR